MEIKDIQRREERPVPLSIRTTRDASEWMRKHKASPTAIFNKAVEELMKKNKN